MTETAGDRGDEASGGKGVRREGQRGPAGAALLCEGLARRSWPCVPAPPRPPRMSFCPAQRILPSPPQDGCSRERGSHRRATNGQAAWLQGPPSRRASTAPSPARGQCIS